MPVRKITPKEEKHPDLVKELAQVLQKNNAQGPADEPEIIIEQIKHSNSLHVTVIWDEWATIDPEDRGSTILDAFAQVKGEAEMLRITLALGVTRAEASRIGINQ